MSAFDWQKLYRGYRSRAEAIASRSPDPNAIIRVRENNKDLFYMEDPAGNALVQITGARYSPVKTLQAFIEHWGAIPSATRAGATVDYTNQVRQASQWPHSVDVQGFVHISKPISPNNKNRFFCSNGQHFGGFVIDSNFSLDNPLDPRFNGVILTPWGEYFEFGPLSLVARQTAALASGNKADLITYPWAVNANETSNRMRFNAVRFEGFTHGFVSEGLARTNTAVAPLVSYANAGGSVFDLVEDGTFVEGFRLDRSKDFFVINKFRSWPFGVTGTPLSAPWQDGSKVGLHLRGSDGFICHSITAFNCKHVIDDQRWVYPGRSINDDSWSFITHTFTTIDIDGITGSLEWRNGYGTIGILNSQDRNFFSGGLVTIGGGRLHVFRNNATALHVSKFAEVHINGVDFLLRNPNTRAVTVHAEAPTGPPFPPPAFQNESALVTVQNCVVRGVGGATPRAADVFVQEGYGTLKVEGTKLLGIAPTAGTFFARVERDMPSNDIVAPVNYVISKPASSPNGRYVVQTKTT